jgi:hypothetical protein
VSNSAGRHALLGEPTVSPLRTWVASRLAMVLLAFGGAWQLRDGAASATPGFVTTWDRWDVGLFVKVARFGYDFGAGTHYTDRGTEAFFPGMPLLMRLVHPFVPGFLFSTDEAGTNARWVVTAMLIALVAGGVAAVALWRLAELELDAQSADRVVLYLVVMPYAVFLLAGYSESLFLAFALTGWLAARRRHWPAAGLLVAASAFVRVSGVFLAVGLVVEYVVTRRRAGEPLVAWSGLWLLAPVVTVGGYVVWLHEKTGRWDAWQHAQEIGWGRRFVSPLRAWQTTWEYASRTDLAAPYVWSYRAEIVAVLLGLALVVALIWLRRWGEATFVGLNLAALATSTFYFSVTRAALTWFPLYLLVARATRSRRWLHAAVLWTCLPLLAVLTLTFTSGRWVG